MNLVDFQIAVSNDDDEQALDLITEIDLKTESMAFHKAADHFGFKVFKHRGKTYATLTSLAGVFGYGDESGLRKLCKRHGFGVVPLSTFGHDVRVELRKSLDIHSNNSKVTLLTWDTFLFAGAKGENDNAKKVFAYLLEMERGARVAIGGYASATGKQLVNPRYAECNVVINMISKVDRIENRHLKLTAAEHLDDVMNGGLKIGKQALLFSDEETTK